MQPLITTGVFSVVVGGHETGRLRATSSGQQWYLGSQWASGSPDTVELRRTSGIAGNADKWLERAHADLRPFARGEVCRLDRMFPSYLRSDQDGLAFGILDESPDPASEWMQLDPGVVTIWSPGHYGNRPDIGYGCIEVRADGSRIETWVAVEGASPQTGVRIERVWRGSNRMRAQEKFRTLTRGVPLAHHTAMRSIPTVYTSYMAFRNAV
mgnify:CR=1 FL=1